MKIYKKDTICVLIEDYILEKIKAQCRESVGFETGGIIVGYYSSDQASAIIKEITNAPLDSNLGRSNFFRGVKGLKNFLKNVWKQGIYYRG